MEYKSKVLVNELLDNEIQHMQSVYKRTHNEHWLERVGYLESIKQDINKPYETRQEIFERGFFYGSIVGILAGIAIGFYLWT
jgi:hypothetical protein